MKRGKDEEKMRPMFPRLHVKDTEKGGPRAPPRNKMALYEQLSIPSQRFSRAVMPCNPSITAASLVPPMIQGGNDRSMFVSSQGPSRHPSEKQYSQYSDLSTPLEQRELRKKSDEDDYRVPIFVHSIPSQGFDKYDNEMDQEPSNNHCITNSLKFQKAKETGVLKHNMIQEGKNQKEDNSKKFVTGWVKSISHSSPVGKPEGLKKQTVSSLSHEPGDKLVINIDTDDTVQPELCADSQPSNDRHITADLGENMAAAARRISSNSEKALPSEDQNIVHDLSNDTGSHDDASCRSLQTGNLERGDSVSETSILDNMSGVDITPDDIVGIIGQNHFWKARRAIAQQQRVFAVQIFELHRLMKVQKLIAASPHILLEESAYLAKPVKPLPGKKLPLKAIPNVSKQKGNSEKPNHTKECSAENTVEKAPPSTAQNRALPSSCQSPIGNSQAPSISTGDHNAKQWCSNHPHGHQWLVPVMSPSEGLVYKPYPGPGSLSQACGGCGPPGSNPMTGNFLTPAYGLPASPVLYQLPSFPPMAPHGYFPPYGVPVMNTTALSSSSVGQANPTAAAGHSSARDANFSSQHNNPPPTSQKNMAVPDATKSHTSEDAEVQASTASNPNESRQGSRVSTSSAMEGRNMLPLFPTSPAVDASKSSPRLVAVPRHPSRVIKVVPHNAITAPESAARIFQSIQEERKQHDSV